MARVQATSPDMSPEDFNIQFYSSGLIQDRLAFLICFIDRVLEYNSLFHHGAPSPSDSSSQSHLPCLPLSDPWVCRLCQTSHQEPKSGKGRKWYKNICEPFMKLNIDDKLRFVKKEQLCKICTFSKASPIHGDGPSCPFTTGPCDLCIQAGDYVRANHHAVELHHGPRQDCTLVGPQGGSQDVKHNNNGQARTEQIKPTILVHPMQDVPRVASPNIYPPHTTSGVPCLALSPTVVGEAGTGARFHLSLKNIDALRPSNIISAIKIAFKTRASFSENTPHPSTHVGVEVRPAGNVVHPKPAIKMARLVAKKPKKIIWANPVSVLTPVPVWSGQFEDQLSTCDVTSVGTGSCHTYSLFQRKEIRFGFFKTFQFLVALLSVSCQNRNNTWRCA